MSSWQIDPATGDYVMKDGKPVPSDSLTIPAYYRIKTKRGGWMYAPDDNYGSDLWMLKKNSGSTSLNMMQKAVQPIIDDGRATEINVSFDSTQPSSRNNQAVDVEITSAEGTPEVLNLPPVGD